MTAPDERTTLTLDVRHIGARRYRFTQVCDAGTFGGFVTTANSVDNAVDNAVSALKAGDAFWRQ